MSHYHELGGHSRNSNRFPQIARLPESPLPSMRVDQIRTMPYLLRNPKSKTQPSDLSPFENQFKHLTSKQKKALATALFVTSIGLGLAADSNIAHASAPAEISQQNCGIDWFDPSQTCMCDYTEGNPPMTVRKPGNGCGGQQTQKTLPDPKSEVHTGLDREIPGATTVALCSIVPILAALGGLAIFRRPPQ